MPVSRRTLTGAAIAGLVVAATALFGGVWLARALDDDAAVDGEVVLDEPGIYQQPSDEVNESVAGELVPGDGLEDTTGAPVSLTDYRGEPLVVNLWFTRCPPCARELVDFAEVHAEFGSEVRFIGVDPFDTVEAMERFAAERGVEYELLRDPERTFTNEIGVVAFPVTLFVDRDGRIVRQTGVIDADELRATIDEVF